MKSREEILKARQDRLDHISESFNKAKEVPIGTVATHGGKKMKKVGPGKWEPVKEESKKESQVTKPKVEGVKEVGKNASGGYTVHDPSGKKIGETMSRVEAEDMALEAGNKKIGEKKPIDVKMLASYLKSTTRSLSEAITEVADYYNISRTEAIAALADAEKHIREEKKNVKIDPSKLSKKELYDAVNKKYNTSFKPGDIEEFEDDEFRVQLDPEDIKNIVDDETK